MIFTFLLQHKARILRRCLLMRSSSAGCSMRTKWPQRNSQRASASLLPIL